MTAAELFSQEDPLVEWAKANPDLAATLIVDLQGRLQKLDRAAHLQSWKDSPDRMGS